LPGWLSFLLGWCPFFCYGSDFSQQACYHLFHFHSLAV
jgi:hypothetical protein